MEKSAEVRIGLTELGYRIRLFPIKNIPILRNLGRLINSENFISMVDLPQAEGFEKQALEQEAERLKAIEENDDTVEQGADMSKLNKENIPQGCELIGDPLRVTFLTIKKLDQQFAALKQHVDEIEDLVPSDRILLDAHMLPCLKASTLLNKLSSDKTLIGSQFSTYPLVIFSEADNQQRQLLCGFFESTGDTAIKSSFKGFHLGPLSMVSTKLYRMAADKRQYSLDELSCTCTFDLLRNTILLKSSGHFEPATFTVKAEWPIALLNSNRGYKKSPEISFLLQPPPTAVATVRFKPGWMDRRIAQTDQIYELKYLLALSLSLKDNQLPWKPDSKPTDDPAFIFKRVQDLVRGVMSNSDASKKVKQAPNSDAPEGTDSSINLGLDFVDSLWEILKPCNKIEILKNCFQLIYNHLADCNLNVRVSSKKTSSLAKMFRVRNPADIMFPRLEPMTCVQLLVELGLDRFQSNLVHQFVSKQYLSGFAELEPFFLKFSAPLEERIARLLPLYYALQSILMIEKSVRLVHHERIGMTKRLLAHFTKGEQGEDEKLFNREFSFTTTMDSIYANVLRNAISEWILIKSYGIQAQQPALVADEGRKVRQRAEFVHDVVYIAAADNLMLRHIKPFPLAKNEDKNEGKETQLELAIPDVDLSVTKLTAELEKRVKMEAESETSGTTFLKDQNADMNNFECIFLTFMTHKVANLPNDLPSTKSQNRETI